MTSSLTPAELRGLLSFIESLCHAAGEVHLRHWRKLQGYDKKGAIDLVTVADREAEELIVGAIRDRHPGHRILGEEGGEQGAAQGDSPFQWVIDPIDGTTNFAHGLTLFCVSIGLQHHGQTIAGGIFAPALRELYLAARGQGATRNGDPIRVSKVETLDDALIVTGFPYNRLKHLDWLMGTFGDFLSASQGVVRLGSAALDLANVAGGGLDGFYEAGLHPWDVCAGALLVEEAGGRMSDFAGGPFDIFGKRLVASNRLIHGELLEILGRRELEV